MLLLQHSLQRMFVYAPYTVYRTPSKDGSEACSIHICAVPTKFLTANRSAVIQAKGESGWSLPLQKGAKKAYDEATQAVKLYFQHPNEELYRLMESLGPSSGWRGTFESL